MPEVKVCKPRGNMVLLAPISTDEDNKSRGGIILAPKEEIDRVTGKRVAMKAEPHRGRIVAFGPDCKYPYVQIGQEVVYDMGAAITFPLVADVLVVCSEEAIVATIDYEGADDDGASDHSDPPPDVAP